MPKSGGRKPVESHKTAAWSNIERSSRLARTARPSEFQTDNAKQYADENEK
jgi:hypothetical protein